MEQNTLAFAPTSLSTACGAASSTFHRPFPLPMPSIKPSRPATTTKTITIQRYNNHASPLNPSNNFNNNFNHVSSSSDLSNDNNDSQRSLASLHELTERIADLLHVGSIHKNNIHCPKDAPLGYLTANTHIAVIFGKHLIRDQMTVEYAKRIITFIKQLASDSLNPNIICFTGGKNLTNTISEAAAGYLFFRTICEEVNLDVSKYEFILEENSKNTKENLYNCIDELRSKLGSDIISTCHFTLISSDYHLIRMQEIHRLSPRQSMLFPLEVSTATWNCIFAAYPFCVSRDACTAFLGRAIVLANDLGILLVNLNGVIDDREFVSKENLHRLNETFAKMREMYRVIDSRSVTSSGSGRRPKQTNGSVNNRNNNYLNNLNSLNRNKSPAVSTSSGFQFDMRTHAETLELAIHDLREVQTLLNPLLHDVGASVSRDNLRMAKKLLSATVSRIRSSMDPDRILRVHDRLAIIDDMNVFIEQKTREAPQSGLAYVVPPSTSPPLSSSPTSSSSSSSSSSSLRYSNLSYNNNNSNNNNSNNNNSIPNRNSNSPTRPSSSQSSRRSSTLSSFPSSFSSLQSSQLQSSSSLNNYNSNGANNMNGYQHNQKKYDVLSEFDEELIGGSSPISNQRFRRSRTVDVNNEVTTWQGHSVAFEGNGKKIARDGPNLVITTDTPLPSSQQQPTSLQQQQLHELEQQPNKSTTRKKRSTSTTRRTATTSRSRGSTTEKAVKTKTKSTTSSSASSSSTSSVSKSSSSSSSDDVKDGAGTRARRRSTATRKRQTSNTTSSSVAKTKRKNSRKLTPTSDTA